MRQVVALKFISKAKLGLPAGYSAAPSHEPACSPDLAHLHREVGALIKVRGRGSQDSLFFSGVCACARW